MDGPADTEAVAKYRYAMTERVANQGVVPLNRQGRNSAEDILKDMLRRHSAEGDLSIDVHAGVADEKRYPVEVDDEAGKVHAVVLVGKAFAGRQRVWTLVGLRNWTVTYDVQEGTVVDLILTADGRYKLLVVLQLGDILVTKKRKQRPAAGDGPAVAANTAANGGPAARPPTRGPPAAAAAAAAAAAGEPSSTNAAAAARATAASQPRVTEVTLREDLIRTGTVSIGSGPGYRLFQALAERYGKNVNIDVRVQSRSYPHTAPIGCQLRAYEYKDERSVSWRLKGLQWFMRATKPRVGDGLVVEVCPDDPTLLTVTLKPVRAGAQEQGAGGAGSGGLVAGGRGGGGGAGLPQAAGGSAAAAAARRVGSEGTGGGDDAEMADRGEERGHDSPTEGENSQQDRDDGDGGRFTDSDNEDRGYEGGYGDDDMREGLGAAFGDAIEGHTDSSTDGDSGGSSSDAGGSDDDGEGEGDDGSGARGPGNLNDSGDGAGASGSGAGRAAGASGSASGGAHRRGAAAASADDPTNDRAGGGDEGPAAKCARTDGPRQKRRAPSGFDPLYGKALTPTDTATLHVTMTMLSEGGVFGALWAGGEKVELELLVGGQRRKATLAPRGSRRSGTRLSGLSGAMLALGITADDVILFEPDPTTGSDTSFRVRFWRPDPEDGGQLRELDFKLPPEQQPAGTGRRRDKRAASHGGDAGGAASGGEQLPSPRARGAKAARRAADGTDGGAQRSLGSAGQATANAAAAAAAGVAGAAVTPRVANQVRVKEEAQPDAAGAGACVGEGTQANQAGGTAGARQAACKGKKNGQEAPVRGAGPRTDGGWRLISQAQGPHAGVASGADTDAAAVVSGGERATPANERAAPGVVATGAGTRPQPRPPVATRLPSGSGAAGFGRVLPTESIRHLHGYVPPEMALPPLNEGEVRVCGLTFHPQLQPAVQRILDAGRQELSSSWMDPVKRQLKIVGIDGATPAATSTAAGSSGTGGQAPWVAAFRRYGLRPHVVCHMLARMLGLIGGTGSDGAAELPTDSPSWLPGLRQCADDARGGAGLETRVSIKANSVLGVAGGYVLPTTCLPASQSFQACNAEAKAELLRRVGESASAGSFKFLMQAFTLPYVWSGQGQAGQEPQGQGEQQGQPAAAASGTGPSATGSPPAAVVSMLGYGNLAALINDPRVEPRTWIDGNDVESEAASAKANCLVLPISVRGLVLPVLVAVRDIAPGEQLLRDYGADWWQQLADEWDVMAYYGISHEQVLGTEAVTAGADSNTPGGVDRCMATAPAGGAGAAPPTGSNSQGQRLAPQCGALPSGCASDSRGGVPSTRRAAVESFGGRPRDEPQERARSGERRHEATRELERQHSREGADGRHRWEERQDRGDRRAGADCRDARPRGQERYRDDYRDDDRDRDADWEGYRGRYSDPEGAHAEERRRDRDWESGRDRGRGRILYPDWSPDRGRAAARGREVEPGVGRGWDRDGGVRSPYTGRDAAWDSRSDTRSGQDSRRMGPAAPGPWQPPAAARGDSYGEPYGDGSGAGGRPPRRSRSPSGRAPLRGFRTEPEGLAAPPRPGAVPPFHEEGRPGRGSPVGRPWPTGRNGPAEPPFTWRDLRLQPGPCPPPRQQPGSRAPAAFNSESGQPPSQRPRMTLRDLAPLGVHWGRPEQQE